MLAINAASISFQWHRGDDLPAASGTAAAERASTRSARELLVGIRLLLQRDRGGIAGFRLGAFFVLSGLFGLALHVK